MRKNNMRTPKEKEKILKEFYVGKIGRNEICRKYNTFRFWMQYKKPSFTKVRHDRLWKKRGYP